MPRPSVRDRILDAAIETVQHRGYNGCGVQDITAAAGVPKGSFYNHFASKEALGAEVLEQYWQRGGFTTLGILRDETLTPAERLRRYFTEIAAKMANRNYSCGCLIGNLSAELADQSTLVCDRLAEVYAGWTAALETCIEEAQRRGEMRRDLDARVLAAFLVNAWEGAMLRSKVEKRGDAFAQFNEVVFTTLLA
jgi:TetR/AcrR family transcriptional regulator, transcriptional repressor for nem operon